jgi:hypothetical protein
VGSLFKTQDGFISHYHNSLFPGLMSVASQITILFPEYKFSLWVAVLSFRYSDSHRPPPTAHSCRAHSNTCKVRRTQESTCQSAVNSPCAPTARVVDLSMAAVKTVLAQPSNFRIFNASRNVSGVTSSDRVLSRCL